MEKRKGVRITEKGRSERQKEKVKQKRKKKKEESGYLSDIYPEIYK